MSLHSRGELASNRSDRHVGEMASVSPFLTSEHTQEGTVFTGKPPTQSHSPLIPPRTIDELIRQRAATNPTLHIISYPLSGQDYCDYNYVQLDVFAYRAAIMYRGILSRPV